MNKGFRTISFLLFAMGIAYLPKFCSIQTDGFAEWKIRQKETIQPSASLPKKLSTQQVEKILSQPFFYLGKGAQAFAFVSEDDRYVLKFFRADKGTHPLYSVRKFLPAYVRNRIDATHAKRMIRHQKHLQSYQLAHQYLSEESQILYLHRSNEQAPLPPITVFDKLRIVHIIDSSEVKFLLQRRTDPLYPTLENWMASGQVTEAMEALDNLVKYLIKRCQLGLADKDPNLKTNFGFIGTAPVQFDMGRLARDPTKSDPSVYTRDVIRYTDRMCTWLDSWAPELSEHVRETIQKST